MNLYKLTGERINSITDFIAYYEMIYYYSCSYIAEERIEGILKNGIQGKKDAFDILAWKLDGIDKNNTNLQKNIQYRINKSNKNKESNWKYSDDDNGFCQGTYQGGKIDLSEYLMRFKSGSQRLADLKEYASDNGEKALALLAEDAPNGLGPVYMITLLHFLNQGKGEKKYPIYDKFAHTALKVILNDKTVEFGASFEDAEITKDFPSKSKKEYADYSEHLKSIQKYAGKIMNGKYQSYINDIDLFISKTGLDYYKDRSTDRALWVYGHFFNVVK